LKHKKIHLKDKRKTFLWWGWSSTGTGWPERLWSLHPCRYSKPGHGPRWPAAADPAWAGVGPGYLQRCPPASVILSSSDSV